VELVKTIENETKITTYEYDKLGRTTKTLVNNQEVSSYQYDQVGHVMEETLNGVTTKYTYDANGQIKEKLYPSVNDSQEYVVVITFSYDEVGPLVLISG